MSIIKLLIHTGFKGSLASVWKRVGFEHTEILRLHIGNEQKWNSSHKRGLLTYHHFHGGTGAGVFPEEDRLSCFLKRQFTIRLMQIPFSTGYWLIQVFASCDFFVWKSTCFLYDSLTTTWSFDRFSEYTKTLTICWTTGKDVISTVNVKDLFGSPVWQCGSPLQPQYNNLKTAYVTLLF